VTRHSDRDQATEATSRDVSRGERRQVAYLAIIAVATYAGLAGLRLASPPLAPRVNVRWGSVSTEQRRQIERQLSLVAPQHLEGTTWAYDLANPSAGGIDALVHHAAVEDTHGIDRATGTIATDARRGSTRIGRYPLGAWVDSEPIAWLAPGCLWAALLSGIWLALNRRSARHGTIRHIPGSIRSSS
jgi:hypothetical protein